MKKVMILMVMAIMVPGAANAVLTSWDYSYEGDYAPNSASQPSPKWTYYLTGNVTHGSTDGIYTLDTQTAPATGASQMYFWINGATTYLDPSSPNGTVIEWRMKMDPTSGFHYMDIGDGTNIYNFTFRTFDFYAGGGWVAADMDGEFQIIRAEITPGVKADIYLNDVYQTTHPGYANTTLNGIEFGDTSSSRASIAQWDYIRWAEIPEPATITLLGLGGLLIRRKK